MKRMTLAAVTAVALFLLTVGAPRGVCRYFLLATDKRSLAPEIVCQLAPLQCLLSITITDGAANVSLSSM